MGGRGLAFFYHAKGFRSNYSLYHGEATLKIMVELLLVLDGKASGRMIVEGLEGGAVILKFSTTSARGNHGFSAVLRRRSSSTLRCLSRREKKIVDVAFCEIQKGSVNSGKQCLLQPGGSALGWQQGQYSAHAPICCDSPGRTGRHSTGVREAGAGL